MLIQDNSSIDVENVLKRYQYELSIEGYMKRW